MPKFLLANIFSCLLPLCLLTLQLSAQGRFTISGMILGDSQQPLAYGEVLLRTTEDSTWLTFGSIENGAFELEPQLGGTYRLEIRALGYQAFTQSIHLSADRFLDIQLEAQAELLDGITVVGKRNTVVNKNGNLKFTLDHSTLVNPGSTMDMLALLPGVQLNNDRQSIRIIGRGDPLIYLENQRITMQDLNALPVESIKSIEIINNPSARYEADGRVVVLVTRRFNFSDGIRLDLSEVVALRRRFNSYATLTAAWKKKKWEWKANFSYNQIGIWENVSNNLSISDLAVNLQQYSVSSGPRPQFILGGGFYYQIQEGEYISGNSNWRTHTTRAPISTSSTLVQGGQIDEIESFVESFENRSFFTSNVNYNKSLKSKSNVFIGLQYSSYLRDLQNQIFNNYNQQGEVLDQKRFQAFTIDAWAARGDFEQRFAKDQRWEIGVNYYRASADAFLDFDFLNGIPSVLSNYDYEERNYTAYTQLQGSGTGWDYTMGVRSETVTVQGGFREEAGLVIDRNQTLLFPRASFNWQLDSLSSLSFNYSKTIQRPNYLNASSITTFVHPFLEYARNANLQAAINEDFSMNFQYKNQSLSITYFNRQLPVYVSVAYDESQDRLVQSPQNFKGESGFDIRLTSPLTYKLWTMTNLLFLTQVEIQDERAVWRRSRPYLYYYSNHQFRLPKDWTLGLFGWGLSRQLQGVFERNAYWVLGGSINKRFKNQLQLGIYFDDLLRAMQLRESYSINQIDARTMYLLDRRTFGLSLRYAFGKVSQPDFKNRTVDDYLDRIR